MPQPSLTPWKTLSRRTILRHEPFLSVELHEVATSQNQIIPDWAWIITPDYVNVLAQTLDGFILCFRQTKYAIAGSCLAPIGGFVEPGELPELAARRELREETGYEAPDWIPLGSYTVDANRGAGKAHFFVARNAQRIAEPTNSDLEEQQLLLFHPDQLKQALAAGEFKALPWAACVAMGLAHLDSPDVARH